ncbi:MAG: type II toxin-antitoxin system RelE family toxin [Candidatus Nanoarchaeia archaeon]
MKINVEYDKRFDKIFQKLDSNNQKAILKQINKIIENPHIGKPMRYSRRGTREVYAKPFRISYEYIEDELIILFLDIYHKDK